MEPESPTLTAAHVLAARRAPRFPGESQDYAQARLELLAEEIELRRHIERVAARRRRLPPGPVVKSDYRFLDGDGAELGLADLFEGRDTLVTYFWMYGPQRERPCPMCANLLGPLDANARDIGQVAALKVLGRSPVTRQRAFATDRGWGSLAFVQTVGDAYAHDVGALTAQGEEYPALIVYRRDGAEVRLFWAGEMSGEMADPGQDPRDAPEIAPLWNVLDLTPAGRDPTWYPKLAY